jgi:hypothetical protein
MVTFSGIAAGVASVGAAPVGAASVGAGEVEDEPDAFATSFAGALATPFSAAVVRARVTFGFGVVVSSVGVGLVGSSLSGRSVMALA